MKNIIKIVVLIASTFFIANAQKVKSENVPADVVNGFKKLYPDVVAVKWSLSEGNYEGSFKKDNGQVDVVMAPDGKLIQTEKRLSSPNDLPKEVIQSLNKEYGGYKYSDAESITTADGKTLYSVEAKIKGTEYEILYDAQGVFIKKTKEEEENKIKEKGKKHK